MRYVGILAMVAVVACMVTPVEAAHNWRADKCKAHSFDGLSNGALSQSGSGWNDGGGGAGNTGGAVDVIDDPTGASSGKVVSVHGDVITNGRMARTGNTGAANIQRNSRGELWFGFDVWVNPDLSSTDTGINVWNASLQRGTRANVLLVDGHYNGIRLRSPLVAGFGTIIMSGGWHTVAVRNAWGTGQNGELYIDCELVQVANGGGQANNQHGKAQRLALSLLNRGGTTSGEILFDNFWGGNAPHCATPCSLGLDIMASNCPNEFNTNVKGKGRTPMAILGSAGLDVNDIDADSLDVGGESPIKSSVADKATPDSPCACNLLGPDGFDDLQASFSRRALTFALGLDLLPNGTEVPITVTGNLLNGLSFEATDCVTLVGPGG